MTAVCLFLLLCGRVFSTLTASVSQKAGSQRELPLLGLGNELVWQSVNDTRLAAAVRETGAAVGRYPGGTPSDYWDWRAGWASDVAGDPVRRATPADWAVYASAAGARRTLLVLNQLTANVSEAVAGLDAHAAAGTDVALVEMGNEMYDSTRADVVQAYPNGSAYARKMAAWAARVRARHRAAKVALVAMTWREANGPREAAWNGQVFDRARPELLANVSAAALHPYFGIRWSGPGEQGDAAACGTGGRGASGTWLGTENGCGDACCCQQRCGARAECAAWQYMDSGADAGACYLKSTAEMLPNPRSSSGVSPGPPPPPAPPAAVAVAAVLASAFRAAEQNARMASATIPASLELWVTELAAYGAPSLNFTWLEALVNVLFETLLLLRMRRLSVLAPYCVVCGDPIAPNFLSPAAQPSPPTRSVVPPALAGSVQWNHTLRSAAHSAYFRLIADALAEQAAPAALAELAFTPNPPLPGAGGAADANTTQLVGWRAFNRADDCTRSLFALNLGADNATLVLPPTASPQCARAYAATLLFPRTAPDAVRPRMALHELGRLDLQGELSAEPGDAGATAQAFVAMPPYSILSFRTQ
eukprot:g2722.t1